MNPDEIRLSAYKTIKEKLDMLFASGGIPNISGFQKTIRDLRKRIKLIDSGTQFFANNLDDVEKAQLQTARLSGQLQAYEEKYDRIKSKLKENL